MGFMLTPATTSVLRTAGPVFYSAIQLSSVRTAVQIAEEKDVGDLSPVPFLSLLSNGVIGTLYGILADDKSLIYSNATAIVAGLGCAATYYMTQEVKDNKSYAIAATICAVAAILAAEGNRQLLGSLNCALCVALLASPLATLKTVIDTKSTNSLPFWTSLNTWFNGLSWSLFGLLVMDDPFVYGPNMLGFVFATVQMSLFAAYGLPDKMKAPKEMF